MKAIEALAEYLTGPLVAHNSVLLRVPGHQAHAKRFFDLRAAFGVRGYDTKETAVSAINLALANGVPRNVTAAEDNMLRNAAKASSTIVAPGKLIDRRAALAAGVGERDGN